VSSYNSLANRNVFLAGTNINNGNHQNQQSLIHQSNILDGTTFNPIMQQNNNQQQQSVINQPQYASGGQGLNSQGNTSNTVGQINSNLQNTFVSKPTTHSSMIYNTSTIHNNLANQANPLNQSMVTSYIHSNNQNMINYPSMSNFSNTASHRTLNLNQNNFV